MKIMREEANPMHAHLSKESYVTVGQQAHLSLLHNDSYYYEELIKSAISTEIDGLCEAKKIAMQIDASDERLYVFLLTYQSVKIDNIERLARGLDSALFKEVIERHRTPEPTDNPDCYLFPIYVLLERSYASLESLGQLCENQSGLNPRMKKLTCEIISQEKHLIAKADRLKDRAETSQKSSA